MTAMAKSPWPRGSSLGGEELLEASRVLERSDHREAQCLVGDQLLRDSLDVFCSDRLDAGEHFLRLRCRPLEDLAPEAEHDQPVGALDLEDEPALRKILRLAQLVCRDGLRG